MNTTIDLRAIADLNRLGKRVAPAVEKALDRTAQVVLNAKTRNVRRTYSKPIPRSSTGRPKWKRSGAFLQGQTVESRRGERTITTTGEAAKYEERLAKLPTGADGVNRSNPAAEDAQRIVEPQIVPVFESVLKAELGL